MLELPTTWEYPWFSSTTTNTCPNGGSEEVCAGAQEVLPNRPHTSTNNVLIVLIVLIVRFITGFSL